MADKGKKGIKVVQAPTPTTADAKRAAIETAIAKIDKDFGKGTIMRLGEAETYSVDCIPTGSISLDAALGIGGVPKGRIVEIYGPESSGKTTVALHIVAEAQKLGGEAAFIDVEHALDPIYARALGVDVDNLLVSQPDSGEQALEIMEALVRSNAIDVLVLDSVAAMVTKAEIDGIMGDSHVGLLARLMSQAMRKLTSAISRSNCVAIFINQLREKIGNTGYGPNEVTTGGRALKFYSSVRLDVRRIETLKVGNDAVGSRTKVKVAKNKVSPPFKECEFDIMYGQGISRTGEVLDMAVELDIVKKGGSWFSYGDTKLGQGRDNSKEFLKNNPDIMKEIEEKIAAESKRLMMTSSKDRKKMASKAAEAAGVGDSDAPTPPPSAGSNSDIGNVLVNPEEDDAEFSEFAPDEMVVDMMEEI